MIKMPVGKIIEKITEKTGLTEQEIKDTIKQKMEALAGLISEEGAAHIIANENGVKLFEEESGRIQIGNLLSGMRNVELVGRVQDIYEVREFQRGDKTGKVGSFLVGDETGIIRIVLWNDQTDKLKDLEKDMIVKLQFAYVKDNQGRKEIHLRDNSNILMNPPDEVVGEVKKLVFTRKQVYNLQEGNDQELLGNVMQLYDIRYFEVCPHCNKRTRPENNIFKCPTHGEIQPSFSYVTNAVLDDGTGSIRTVFFANQLQNLTGESHENLLGFKQDPPAFDAVKKKLLGKIIKVSGRATKNKMFDRIEFVANRVNTDPDATEELNRHRKQTVTATDSKGQEVVKEIPVVEEVNE